jgi:hypothetical protein
MPDRKLGVAVGLVCAAALTGPSAALADGGTSIASATPATYGTQLFGNTANGGREVFDPDCDGSFYRSWWTLPVTAGDAVTINWESDEEPFLGVYDVGTTDYTRGQTSPVKSDSLNSNHKRSTRFKATRSGSMPFDFATVDSSCNINDSTPGPYDFFASVRHSALPQLSVVRTNRHRHTVTFRTAVHNPDGVAISDPALNIDVLEKSHGRWVSDGSVQPGQFRLVWRQRKSWGKAKYLRVRVQGDNYLTKSSRTVRVVP